MTVDSGVGGEKTHAPPGRAIVLAVGCCTGSAAVAATVVTVVGGTVSLGVPSGGSVSGAVESSLTLHPATSTARPTATRASCLMTPNGRSLVAGWSAMSFRWSAIVVGALAAGCSAGATATGSTTPAPTTVVTSTSIVPPSSTAPVDDDVDDYDGAPAAALRVSVHGHARSVTAIVITTTRHPT